jgi:hypothetical protein
VRTGGESGREGRIDNDAVFSMSYIRGEDREQASFLPARIDDYVGAEAAVRVIDAFAEGLDVVDLGFVRAVPAATGRPGYYGCMRLSTTASGLPAQLFTGSLRRAARPGHLKWGA